MSVGLQAREGVAPPANVRPKRGGWDRFGGKFLAISILAHVLFGVIAAYFVVQVIAAKHKLTFKGGPPSPNPSQRAMEHKVQMAKKQNTMSAPAQSKRIVTTGLAKIALPDMPSMPSVDPATPTKMAGMGGLGVGLGPSLGVMGSGGGAGGGAIPFFGLRDNTGVGLEGTFYDFTKEPDGKTPIKGINTAVYAGIVHNFVAGDWTLTVPHYTSPVKLYAKFFLFPAIVSLEAGAAFHSPTSPDGNWIGHYKGKFASPDTATYRFIGFGDNENMVRVNGKLVLDASDHGDSGMKRERLGDIAFPKKGATPIFSGDWMHLQEGESLPIEVVVGDEGGIFCAGLFVQKQGVQYKQGQHGVPELPLFTTGALSEPEKQKLREFLPDACLTGPVFAPPKSIFDSFNH